MSDYEDGGLDNPPLEDGAPDRCTPLYCGDSVAVAFAWAGARQPAHERRAVSLSADGGDVWDERESAAWYDSVTEARLSRPKCALRPRILRPRLTRSRSHCPQPIDGAVDTNSAAHKKAMISLKAEAEGLFGDEGADGSGSQKARPEEHVACRQLFASPRGAQPDIYGARGHR